MGSLLAESDYTDPNVPDLGNPVKDAEAFQKVLLADYTFKADNLYLLKNPTRSKTIQTFEQFSNNLNENDNLIIFYAGHGYWDAYKEKGYWLPSDAQATVWHYSRSK